jgi:hypothetical protein
MKYLYARLTRTNLATIDNDAKSCYDRILCNIAMIVSKYYGAPETFCKTQGNNLKNSKFKLRTALGESQETYEHTENTPIHGTGQGSCARLFEKMQADGILWSELLKASGGELELSKCFYYLLSWEWDKKGNPKPTIISYNKDDLPNNQTNFSIPQREATISHKTLGTYKSILGDETDHIKYLTEKSDQIGKLALKAQFNRRQARLAYSTTYVPSISYSLSAMYLSEKTINKIQQKATTTFLNLCGYDRHFSRILIFAPVLFGGLGMAQLYVESCCAKIELLICHINSQTTLGKIIQINLNWTQLLSGLSTNFLNTQDTIDYITPTWFHPIKYFLNNIGAKIEITDSWVPHHHRKNDVI